MKEYLLRLLRLFKKTGEKKIDFEDGPITHLPDQVVCLRDNGQPVYKVIFGGRLVKADWKSKGGAQAYLSQLKKGDVF